jgi:uncharacterized protein
MNILVDVEHPAHVHYFRGLIKEVKSTGNNVIVTAVDKDVTFELLNLYKIPFISLGKHQTTLIGKVLALVRNEIKLLFIAIKFKPDVMISVNSPYVAHIGFLMRKKVIGITDTEHATLSNYITNPFTTKILTPRCFKLDYGSKHKRFNGYLEMLYLKDYKADDSIFEILGIQRDQKYSILRFISWDAMHDKGHSGISEEVKYKALDRLLYYGHVFISAEGELPNSLEKYRLNIPLDRMHDALYFSELFFGESGTMATESALLGTPSVRVSTLSKLLGNFDELCNVYRLISFFDNGEEGLNRCVEILEDNKSKEKWKRKSREVFKEKDDVLCFLLDEVRRMENG